MGVYNFRRDYTTSSGHGNWVGEIPSVTDGRMITAARFKRRFIPQTIPYSETPESNFPHENDLIKLEGSDGDDSIIIEGKTLKNKLVSGSRFQVQS